MKPFWKREPTKTDEKATEHNMIKMITMTGDYYYAWDGKLYESDKSLHPSESESDRKAGWKTYPR